MRELLEFELGLRPRGFSIRVAAAHVRFLRSFVAFPNRTESAESARRKVTASLPENAFQLAALMSISSPSSPPSLDHASPIASTSKQSIEGLATDSIPINALPSPAAPSGAPGLLSTLLDSKYVQRIPCTFQALTSLFDAVPTSPLVSDCSFALPLASLRTRQLTRGLIR